MFMPWSERWHDWAAVMTERLPLRLPNSWLLPSSPTPCVCQRGSGSWWHVGLGMEKSYLTPLGLRLGQSPGPVLYQGHHSGSAGPGCKDTYFWCRQRSQHLATGHGLGTHWPHPPKGVLLALHEAGRCCWRRDGRKTAHGCWSGSGAESGAGPPPWSLGL